LGNLSHPSTAAVVLPAGAVAADELDAAFYVLPAASSARRCTVFSLLLPGACAAPAAALSYLLMPATTFPSAALRTTLLPGPKPAVLCIRRRTSAQPADASAALENEDISRLREAFKRVLVVDDDAICRRVSSHYLQLIILPSLGIAVDGMDALRVMLVGAPAALLAAVLVPGVHDAPDDASRLWCEGRAWPYDLILLDVQMPRKQGDEVVAQLRRLGCKSIVIAATATSEEGARERLLRCGFDGVLVKPFSSKDITAMLLRMADSLHKHAAEATALAGGGGSASILGARILASAELPTVIAAAADSPTVAAALSSVLEAAVVEVATAEAGAGAGAPPRS
jgi:hypothetical protein